jgi:2-iminobutanoate/2-iminopropanoate deaminase
VALEDTTLSKYRSEQGSASGQMSSDVANSAGMTAKRKFPVIDTGQEKKMNDILRHTISGFPPSMSPSSHAVEAGGFVFLTGQFARNLDRPDDELPAGIADQTERTLRNMENALRELDLGMDRIISVRAFLTNFRRDYDEMNRVYARFLHPEHRPTRTCVGVTDLVRGALIEMDCIAKR